MKKLCVLLALMLFVSTGVRAEYISPQSRLTVLEAMGIDHISQIESGYIFSVEKEQAMELTREQIENFYNNVGYMILERRSFKNPFCGTAVVLRTNEGEKSYFLNSGVQVGMVGANSYMCYSATEYNEVLGELYANFMSSSERYTHSSFNINSDTDYLLLPTQNWAISEAKYAAANSLLPYAVSENFGKAISREQFCILAANYLAVCGNYYSLNDYFEKKNIEIITDAFADSAQCDESVNLLYSLGIINGKSDGSFGPDDALSREQAAVILKNIAVADGKDLKQGFADFKDIKDVSSWAVTAVHAVGSNGVMSGADDKFRPKDFITTEEAVAAINKMFKLRR